MCIRDRFGGDSSLAMVGKYNSSGTLQWLKSLNTGSEYNADALFVSSEDRIFVGGWYANSDRYVAEIDSDGDVVWFNEFQSNNNGESISRITEDSNNNLIISGNFQTDNGRAATIWKYPNDGSLTGTFGDLLIGSRGNTSSSPSQFSSSSCLLYTSPSPRDGLLSRMPSSA